MALVHLIRHAEPELPRVLLGKTDVALRLVELPAARFAAATVFSSPLKRARRTAELLFPDQPITILESLAERGLGDWEGHSWDEIERGWPELAALAARDWLATTPPQAEAWPSFVERVSAAWQVMRPAGKPIAIVAHAGVNAALAELIAGHNPCDFRQAYLEVRTLEFES